MPRDERTGVTLNNRSGPVRTAADPPRLMPVTLEDRVALAKIEDPREAARRQEVALRIVAITLFWLVSLALLIGWGLTGRAGGERDVAALLAVVVPFAAAVIATKNGRLWLGGTYVVLTLAMVLPAMGIAGLG
jgi:hypothetical protein